MFNKPFKVCDSITTASNKNGNEIVSAPQKIFGHTETRSV